MKYLNNVIYLIALSVIAFSCTKSTEPLNKEKNYNVNITYIEDDGINSFEPKDFIDIFDDDLSKLTYELLGYKIKYNLKNGTDDNYFYMANRKIILDNADVFKRDFIDIRNIDYDVLENDIINSLSNETSINIKKLFGYDYGTPLEVISKNIAPSYVESILSVWNSPVKNRNELLVGNRFMFYTALYWKIVAEEFEDSAIVLVNIPIAANYRGMSAKSIADGGFVDRIVIENNHIKPCKSVAVISIYNFLNSNMDNETIKKIFSYYIVQTMGMMFPKYDINEEEKHSIMSEVRGFDYFSWYSNIIN